MTYTAPAGDAVLLDLAGAYAPPAGDAVLLDLGATQGPGEPVEPVWRGPAPQWRGPWSADPTPRHRLRPVHFTSPPPRPRQKRIPWEPATHTPRPARLAWDMLERRLTRPALPWAGGMRRPETTTSHPWLPVGRRRTGYAGPWRPVERATPRAYAAPYIQPPKRHTERLTPWAPLPYAPWADMRMGYYHPPGRRGMWWLPWDQAGRLLYLFRPPPPEPPEPPEPWIPEYLPPPGLAVHLDLQCPRQEMPGDAVRLYFTAAPCPPVEYHPERTITVTHTLTVTRAADGTPIPVRTLTLRADMGSWAWDMNAEPLGAAALANLAPTSEGPRLLAVNVDGYGWDILAEETTEDRRHGANARTLYGRGPAALLAAPYAPPGSRISTQARTAQQIATEALEFTGWSVLWDTVDWTIPAAAYDYADLTPMEVIADLAGAVGAFATANPAGQTITVRPRYPTSPWAWAAATPDAVIPGSLIRQASTRWDERPAFNRAWVAGRTGGVLVSTTRDGTAGDKAAPQVIHPAITHVDAGRERGRVILSHAGRAALVTLTMPLATPPQGPGLVVPGSLVEVQDVAGTWRGLVLGTTIQAAGAAVSQTLEIERRWT